MSDELFSKLNNIIASEETTTNDENTTTTSSTTTNCCTHENVMNDLKTIICKDCGYQISKDCSFEREWRYYGSTDTKHYNDPNRCSFRKIEQKGLYNDLEKYNFKRQIISDANDMYEVVTKKKIFRGKKRKGIVFACVYHAFHRNNSPLSCETLIQMFDIDNQCALKGLKFVNMNLPKNCELRSPPKTNDIHNLIQEIMKEFNATPGQIQETLSLYKYLINKSSLLNRSRPGSVAAAIVKFYILKKNPQFTNEFFKNKIRLSELTLTRITREIELILA